VTTSSADGVAAVLAPVYRDEEGRLRLVLIVRVDRGHHGGQLAFPGGRVDEGETPLAAALREAEEEVGLEPASVRVVAELPAVRSGPTNLDVHPFLGRIPAGVAWRPNPSEVADVLEPAVAELWDPAIRRELLFANARRPEGLLVDGIPVGDRVLWGMTLRILDDLVPRLLAGAWDEALR